MNPRPNLSPPVAAGAPALEFAAVVYYLLVRALAHHEALWLAREQWIQNQWLPLVEQAALLLFAARGLCQHGRGVQPSAASGGRAGSPRGVGLVGRGRVGVGRWLGAGRGLRSPHARRWRHRHCAGPFALGLGMARGRRRVFRAGCAGGRGCLPRLRISAPGSGCGSVGRSARLYGLLCPSCRRSFRDRAAPALPSPWCSACCSLALTCAPARCG